MRLCDRCDTEIDEEDFGKHLEEKHPLTDPVNLFDRLQECFDKGEDPDDLDLPAPLTVH
jgi:hypothetical protein